ncbi:MAG: hypothetical protein ACPGVG_20605, partial [Mycobacterium sp.]
QIAHLAPCDPAVRWLADRTDMQQSWDDCPRGDWLLWLLAECGADHATIVLAACDCARLALVHVPEGEDRPRLAIEAAEGWARGDGTTLEQVKRAARAARAAYAAANAAAYPAVFAAYSADADAAYSAADAAYAAAYATDAAYAADAAAHAELARLVRARFPYPPTIEATP